MVLIRPETIVRPLQQGDEVITVAASSVVDDEQTLLEGLKVFEGWGLICKKQNVSERRWGYLAGKDEVRYQELHQKAPLLAFARGGWGAARLLERPQPWDRGWLLGFSDVTTLLLARLKAGFDGGIHGPMLNSLAHEPEWSKERLHAILFGQEVPDLIGEGWFGGIAIGPLIIANLTVGTHLIGTNHFPDVKGSIIVFEDIGEAPYRIDRMLTHWRLAGLLKDIAGIGFGRFTDCESLSENPQENSFLLEDILKERCFDLNIPVVGNLPIGHGSGNASLPLGRKAKLNGKTGRLSLIA